MSQWITLQEAADLVGVRKGTLCMWRLRNRFPFRSKGKGRGLVISRNSVESWLKAGGKAGVKPGRPAKKAGRPPKAGRRGKVGRPPKAAARRVGRPRSSTFSFMTEASLEEIQTFVASIKAGKTVQVIPEKKGYKLVLK